MGGPEFEDETSDTSKGWEKTCSEFKFDCLVSIPIERDQQPWTCLDDIQKYRPVSRCHLKVENGGLVPGRGMSSGGYGRQCPAVDTKGCIRSACVDHPQPLPLPTLPPSPTVTLPSHLELNMNTAYAPGGYKT